MPLLDKILWENTTINKIIGSKMMKEMEKKKNLFTCISFPLNVGLIMQWNLLIAPNFSRFTRFTYFKH